MSSEQKEKAAAAAEKEKPLLTAPAARRSEWQKPPMPDWAVDAHRSVKKGLSVPFSAEVFEAAKALWKEHSLAEEKGSVEGLLATLTPDSVYTMHPAGVAWVGHKGARNFYTQLLTAFPDIEFRLT
jgi:hypothetical protein